MKSPLERRNERIGETGRRAEKHTAKRLGASLVRGSGNGYLKGDLFTGIIHVEAKSTQRLSISLKWDWLRKITKTGLEQHKTPAVTITFTHGDGTPRTGGTWVLIPEGAFNELVRNQTDG